MLKKLTLKNYRCFENCIFPFRDTSILVGSNNAGKSTIIEALRIVSVVALKYKNSNYIVPPKELGEKANAKGIKLNLENLKIDFRSVVHKYNEDEGVNAEIHALFDGDISVKIILNSQVQFAFIYNKKDMITSRSQATKMKNLLLYTMPQIGLIREDEQLLSIETVKKNMETRLSSRHFRNQIYQFKKDHFEEFKDFAESTWKGLRITDFGYDTNENKLSLLVYDSGFAAEVGLMGSGLQMWLQIMWFISRCDKNSTIVLDEPDVYMHPDLQLKILKLVQNKFPQVIIATHSVEIISSVDSRNIGVIDKSSRKMRYSNDYKAVQTIINNLGSEFNLSLARLGNAKKCIFVEGKDMKILDKFYNIINPNANFKLSELPWVALGGWSRFNEALGAARLFFEESNGEIKTYCVLDRDYHTQEEIDALYSKAQENHLELHVWDKKELENYILTPRSIFKLTGLNDNLFESFCDDLFELLDKLKDSTQESMLNHYGTIHKGVQPGTILSKYVNPILNEKWDTLEGKLSICNGKEIISLINAYIQSKYHRTSSREKLISKLSFSDVSEEMKDVIAMLAS